jgi:hypothetical protein
MLALMYYVYTFVFISFNSFIQTSRHFIIIQYLLKYIIFKYYLTILVNSERMDMLTSLDALILVARVSMG